MYNTGICNIKALYKIQQNQGAQVHETARKCFKDRKVSETNENHSSLLFRQVWANSGVNKLAPPIDCSVQQEVLVVGAQFPSLFFSSFQRKQSLLSPGVFLPFVIVGRKKFLKQESTFGEFYTDEMQGCNGITVSRSLFLCDF
uniref:(northern house mosquito) hypothetical protein n=1 Tax=Culex pipiens TaxID=7175 RepID=A0A8D8F345_CULPI